MSYAAFDAIQIGLASPEMIREWSYGEVKKPETINYRTLKPERDGLFCEKIFGPTKDWECHCGKYKKIRYKGKICDRCGVEVTKSSVRRERMGHIELAAPVSHIWFFKGIPSQMGLLLDMTPRVLEKILYFAAYIVVDPGSTPLRKYQILAEKEYREMREKYEDDFKAGMGAETIREILREMDCESFAEKLRAEAIESSGQKKAKLIKRLEIVDAFRRSGNDPSWMIIDILPVIPPEIRPMVQLDGGRFATSDLNDLYRRVINRNNRLKRLISLSAPDIIVRNEKRMLQEAVDALIDNGRRGRAVTGGNSRALRSLSDMLKGKQGRFRQNLLGKRVDYSGRSVIVVGPDLKLYQCGVPKEMAIELFRPFIMKKLVEDGISNNIKSAKKMVDRGEVEVWDALEIVIREHPVLLNRAPTLHRLGIQAFEPVLVEGRALKLHPLVCTAYNADFDGDQMAIHVPLSAEAQAEARILMLSANNLLHPKDGQPVTVPTHDMILGSYYLTSLRGDEKGAGKIFASPNEALTAYQNDDVGVHAPVKVRVERKVDGVTLSKVIETTVGRIIFNEPIPQDLGFVDRNDPERMFDYEISFQTGKKQLEGIIRRCIARHGFTLSVELLDNIKSLGFKYSTRGAITISVSDMTVPEAKSKLIQDTEHKVVAIERQYKRGFITNDERYRLAVREWEKTTKDVTDALASTLDELNPVYIMANSGARGSMNQIRQLAGMRGLMANTAGKTIEIPIKASLREGLTVLEYFTSARGARKGLTDTALRTADSGYLTRRLVDVSQDVIIREYDCGTHEGVTVSGAETVASRDFNDYARFAEYLRGRTAAMPIYDVYTGEVIVEKGAKIESEGVAAVSSRSVERVVLRLEESSLGELIHGRYPVSDILSAKTGETLFTRDNMLSPADAAVLEAHDVFDITVRSVLACESESGVCSKCYGINLATGSPVSIGEAVGVIAAQSIGEPGTQLTMRTFHTGGIAGDDITQGLPRVEELFEARKPKKMSILAEIGGKIVIEETRRNAIVAINIINQEREDDIRVYQSPYSAGIRVNTGDIVARGDRLTDGALNPHDVMRIRGKEAAQSYLISEVQKVYGQHGVDINDKHIEVIVRQMMRKVRVEDGGDTPLLSSTIVDILDLRHENKIINERIAAGETELRTATYSQLLMGITKASLATESFLSAASFQETTKVLTGAAIKGKVDRLVGLKENVIIGKLVPAGSGLSIYRKFDSEHSIALDSAAEDDVDLSVLLGTTNAI
ncbi:MAG: DNA-directed RNA polymerase subunit beta' [Oscillospiraceae bacterium]|jgi:DNA-directed RNA polymerase subunit beta'|nr:DNA-directed RNA polymerase subunit beta' [Oscillospiraceae bacterium]